MTSSLRKLVFAKKVTFSIKLGADFDEFIHGGQPYRVFPFSKTSVVQLYLALSKVIKVADNVAGYISLFITAIESCGCSSPL
jgi:hypothetical protein